MKKYGQDLNDLLKKRYFLGFLLLLAVLAYGFAATNLTLSIDDLEADTYFGSGMAMLKSGRFGMILWSLVVGYGTNIVSNAFTIDVIAVTMLILAALNYCVLFRRISGNGIDTVSCMVFSAVMVSYPLMNEIWEYTAANLAVCGGFLLDSFALLLIHSWLHEGKHNVWKLITASLLMMWVCSSYESLVPVYIFFVFAVLAMQVVYGTEKEKTFKEIICQGLVYAAVLAVGLLLRILVHRMLLGITGLEAAGNGETAIAWLINPAWNNFLHLASCLVQDYLLKSLIYLPITEMVLAALAGIVLCIILCKKYGWILLLPTAGMYLSLVLLSLVQGSISPYRTCQVFAVFVAFVLMVFISCIRKYPWKKLRFVPAIALAAVCWLCLYQAEYMNHFLTLNHLRSEEEIHAIRQIGTELQQHDLTKPVIFYGYYTISEDILEAASIPETSTAWKLYNGAYQVMDKLITSDKDWYSLDRKLPQSNVNSMLQWGIVAFENQSAMQKQFSFFGYDYIAAEFDVYYDQAEVYALENDMPIYPQDGYIVDMGDYLIVRLG